MKLKDPALLKTNAYINGSWIAGESTYTVLNPYDNSPLAVVADLGEEATNEAIEAAAAAFKSWSQVPAGERASILKRWYALQMEHQEDLAMILTLEQGKPLAEAKGEIAYGASFIEWFAEEARRTYGEVIPGHQGDKRIITLKQPVGVVAAITPWNFPNAMITRKVGPALAAGCTVVVKPAEYTPLSALALAELGERAGIPKGVLNIVTTNRPAEVGTALTANPLVRKLSFTGSTAVGKLLLSQCAGTVKRVSMELGGNAPFIVFDDADLDQAVEGAMIAKYRNAGQTCVCANRIYVQARVYNAFVKKLTAAIQQLSSGNGLQPGVAIGPMIDDKALDFVEGVVKDATDKGAKVLTGGKRGVPAATFFEPTLLTEVNAQMKVHTEEIFGPVAPIFRFETEAEAIKAANDTPFGLAAYFYARDNARVWRVSEALEYGMIGVNTGLVSTTVAPFGGVKESGLGREGSRHGIDEYLELKYVCQGGIG